MPKNIVICSDGTGNSGVKGRGTNVFKLYEAVDVVGHLEVPGHIDTPGHRVKQRPCEQVAIYDDGVGTQKLKLLRALAGAFGFGLARNVRQLYAELARCYEDGDQIYMFGFSRGAFTIRTLAGFICAAGILDISNLTAGQVSSCVSEKYRNYRKSKPAILERLTTPFTQSFRFLWRLATRPFKPAGPSDVGSPKVRIRFIGVWDTVDAVGFPVPGISTVWNTVIHRFKFTNKALPECVERACHALAIDEERASFELSLWDHEEGKTEQVWFAGVHSNVGGGYPKQGMSLVTLEWMLQQAEEVSKEEGSDEPSLHFRKGLRELYHDGQNVRDYLYDSRSGPAIYYRYQPRHIARICADANAPIRVHHSAIDRVMGRPRGYAPGNLPESFEVVATPGQDQSKLNLGERQLRERKVESPVSNKLPAFAGANGFWKLWRQTVQIGFYAAQIGVIYLAIAHAPAADSVLAVKQTSRISQWSMGVAEAAVAPLPGDWAQQYIVRPMFAFPEIGYSFLLVFVICYLLGLWGRSRMEAINSERWRHLELVPENRAE